MTKLKRHNATHSLRRGDFSTQPLLTICHRHFIKLLTRDGSVLLNFISRVCFTLVEEKSIYILPVLYDFSISQATLTAI